MIEVMRTTLNFVEQVYENKNHSLHNEVDIIISKMAISMMDVTSCYMDVSKDVYAEAYFGINKIGERASFDLRQICRALVRYNTDPEDDTSSDMIVESYDEFDTVSDLANSWITECVDEVDSIDIMDYLVDSIPGDVCISSKYGKEMTKIISWLNVNAGDDKIRDDIEKVLHDASCAVYHQIKDSIQPEGSHICISGYSEWEKEHYGCDEDAYLNAVNVMMGKLNAFLDVLKSERRNSKIPAIVEKLYMIFYDLCRNEDLQFTKEEHEIYKDFGNIMAGSDAFNLNCIYSALRRFNRFGAEPKKRYKKKLHNKIIKAVKIANGESEGYVPDTGDILEYIESVLLGRGSISLKFGREVTQIIRDLNESVHTCISDIKGIQENSKFESLINSIDRALEKGALEIYQDIIDILDEQDVYWGPQDDDAPYDIYDIKTIIKSMLQVPESYPKYRKSNDKKLEENSSLADKKENDVDNADDPIIKVLNCINNGIPISGCDSTITVCESLRRDIAITIIDILNINGISSKELTDIWNELNNYTRYENRMKRDYNVIISALLRVSVNIHTPVSTDKIEKVVRTCADKLFEITDEVSSDDDNERYEVYLWYMLLQVLGISCISSNYGTDVSRILSVLNIEDNDLKDDYPASLSAVESRLSKAACDIYSWMSPRLPLDDYDYTPSKYIDYMKNDDVSNNISKTVGSAIDNIISELGRLRESIDGGDN